MEESFYLRPLNEVKSIDIVPETYVVVKSKLGSSSNAQEGSTKIFVNIVHNAKYPSAPEIPFNPSIVYPLIMNNEWEIPIITTAHVTDRDKQGNTCLVWDCCVNSACIQWCTENEQLKEILIEWCLESCELRSELEIDRDAIKFPKLKYKGHDVRKIEVLENDLHQTAQSDTEKTQVSSSSNEFLEMKRNYENGEEDSDQLMELRLPGNSTSSKTKTTPLIQEVQTLETLANKSMTSNAAPQHNKLDACRYEVTMRKPDSPTKPYKLKVEITTNMENCNSLDFSLHYDQKEHTLVIKNLNTHIYKENLLQVPLPKFEMGVDDKVEAFFIKSKRTMYVII